MQVDMVPGDEKVVFKFAQLYRAIRDKCNIKIIEKLVEQQADINFAISPDSTYRISRFYSRGCSTILHLAYHELDEVDFFISLLNRGANFTKKNEFDQTVLHMMFTKHISSIYTMQKPLENRFINAVLSAHVTHKNFENPCNNDGLSHFHIACMTNNLTAVQFFLDNGVSVDDPVSVDSDHLSGYTPLHLAAIYVNIKVAEILLANGANVHITEASGMTSLHVLIKQKFELLLDLNRITQVNQKDNRMLQEPIGDHDQFINILLENRSTDNDCPDNMGLTNFHVACMLQDTHVAQNLVDAVVDLDHMVSMDSPLWPGYTALHFAAYANLDTITMLINKGASVEAKDSKGLTFLDHCVERYIVNDICSIISLKENWKDLLFSDHKTKLLSFIRTMQHQYECDDTPDSSMINLNMHISMESPLWPGYTPLHLAVLFAKSPKEYSGYFCGDWRDVDVTIIKLYLKNGADLSFQDSRGQTALHLAFRLNYTAAVDVIFRYYRDIPNLSDEDNLSHLHIVCAMGTRKSLLTECVLDYSVVNAVYRGESPVNNVRPGSTPLHAVLVHRHEKDLRGMIEVLLSSGADSRIKDAHGLTPIHWLLGCSGLDVKDDCKELLDQVVSDCVVEDYGLSYLHVASYLDNPELAKRLLENGADVNLAIKRGARDQSSFLHTFDKFTPLHFNSSCHETCELLLDHGANVFAKKADGSIPLSEECVLQHFVWKLQNDAYLQEHMERIFGWTRLHLACYSFEVDGFQDIVKAEFGHVNRRVFLDSPIWVGYTPLHVLMDCVKSRGTSISMLTMLLEKGAEVTVSDEKQDSPITMLFDFSNSNNEHPFPFREEMALLMKHHKDFTFNPVNAQGVSHFHLACYLNDAVAIGGFLSYGVNVNRPIGFFSEWYPGCTPLHLASELQIVDLLIRQGADVQIENVQGRTALEKSVEYHVFNESIVTKIIEAGADINRPNSRGETAFEVAISDRPITMEELVFYLKRGFAVNSCNPLTGDSYLKKILEMRYEDEDLQILIAKIMNEDPSRTLGRTILHHLATNQPIHAPGYVALLRKLIKSTRDIDQQDNEGKTALHLAAEFKNANAVLELLNYGADLHVCDMNDNSTLSDPAINSSCIKNILIIHACRLALLGLKLSRINADIANPHAGVRGVANSNHFDTQITASRDIELGVGSLRLYDFLSETGAISLYPFLDQLDRCKIDQYFESIENETRCSNIHFFLMLQYRKAVKRLELFPLATNSFGMLLGFELPDLCKDNIFKYLPNSGLQNMIISANIEMEEMNMDVD